MISFFPSRTVALEAYGWPVHWYGLLYLAGFLLAFVLLPRLQKYRALTLSRDDWSRVLSAAVIGVIGGGRLGYVFFYEPSVYLAEPLRIFAVWEGGMSSHGGFIGVALALLWSARKLNVSLLALADTATVPIALGLALGRIGNFINQELYGTVTSLSWGIAIPGVEGFRHPTAFYALAKDLLIAGVCFLHLRSRSAHPAGSTTAIFLLLYGALRFMVEFFREPTHSVFSFGAFALTRGQAYSLVILLVGILMLWKVHAKARSTKP